MPLELLIIGAGPTGRAALAEALLLGLAAAAIDEDALVMVEADGGVLQLQAGRLALSRPLHLLLAGEAVPRIPPIPGWALPGVSGLADAVPGEAMWIAAQGGFLAEAAAAFPAAALLDLAVISGLRAEGEAWLRAVSFTRDGVAHHARADRLVLHDGTVPAVQHTRALGCAHEWDAAAQCWVPVCDPWGASSRAGVWVAADGPVSGLRAARGVARAMGRSVVSPPAAPPRPAPRSAISPDDATVICPCEAVTAGAVRAAARLGCSGLNQLKAFTRCGMGSCQARRCGAVAAQVLAGARDVAVCAIAPMRVRFPLRPVPLGLLAALEPPDRDAPG